MSWTRCADCWPEPHWASTTVPAVCWGSPACSQARRTMPLDCSPAWVTTAADDLLDQLRVDPGAAQHLGLGEPEQDGGVHAGEPALPLAERGADGVDDHGVAHGRKTRTRSTFGQAGKASNPYSGYVTSATRTCSSCTPSHASREICVTSTVEPPVELPAGFDPTDPDVMQAGVPHQELLTLRRTAPVSFIEQRRSLARGLPGPRRLLGAEQARRRRGGVQGLDQLLDVPGRRDHPVQPGDGPRGRRADPVPADQPRRARPHQAPPDRLARVHAAGHRRSCTRTSSSAPTTSSKAAVERGEGNFVEDVAAELPLQAIANLLGVPLEDRGKLFDWSNQMMSYDDPEVEGDQAVAFMEILAYSMGAGRRASPAPAGRHHLQAGHRPRWASPARRASAV